MRVLVTTTSSTMPSAAGAFRAVASATCCASALADAPRLRITAALTLPSGTPQASVDYGFQTSENVQQAVRDAAYEGRELTYHPN